MIQERSARTIPLIATPRDAWVAQMTTGEKVARGCAGVMKDVPIVAFDSMK